MAAYRITYMSGSARTGSDNRGQLNHAVPVGAGLFGAALCGAKPGKRGNGWSEYTADAVTCPKCLAKLAKAVN